MNWRERPSLAVIFFAATPSCARGISSNSWSSDDSTQGTNVFQGLSIRFMIFYTLSMGRHLYLEIYCWVKPIRQPWCVLLRQKFLSPHPINMWLLRAVTTFAFSDFSWSHGSQFPLPSYDVVVFFTCSQCLAVFLYLFCTWVHSVYLLSLHFNILTVSQRRCYEAAQNTHHFNIQWSHWATLGNVLMWTSI